MGQGVFTLFEKVTTGKLMEAISKSMDDFLYIFDIQNSKLELSEAAVDRFMIPCRFLDDPLSAVYEEDREMLMKDLSEVAAGKEKHMIFITDGLTKREDLSGSTAGVLW